MNFKKLFPILFLVTSLNISSIVNATQGGSKASKIWSGMQLIRCVAAGEVPDPSDIRAFASESTEDFSTRNFLVELGDLIVSVLNDKTLNMEAVRALVGEIEKGEAINMAEVIQKLKTKLYTPIHDKLRASFTQIAQKREITPLIESEAVQAFLNKFEAEIDEAIQIKFSLMLLDFHQSIESKACSLSQSVESSVTYQKLLQQTEELIGKSLVRSLSKMGLKKGVDFFLPGFDLAFTVVDKASDSVPTKATVVKRGDHLAIQALAYTVGQEKDKTLDAINKKNPLKLLNKYLDVVLRQPGRFCGALVRKSIVGVSKATAKAMTAHTFYEGVEYIQNHEINFLSDLYSSIIDLCKGIDAEAAEAREAYLAAIKEEKQREKADLETALEEVTNEEQAYLSIDHNAAIAALESEVSALKEKHKEQASFLKAGWVSASNFDAEQAEALNQKIEPIKEEAKQQIKLAEEAFNTFYKNDAKSTLFKYSAEAKEKKKELTERRLAIAQQKEAKIAVISEEHEQSASSKKDELRAELEVIAQSLIEKEKGLKSLEAEYKKSLASYASRKKELSKKLSAFEEKWWNKAGSYVGSAASGVVSRIAAEGADYAGQKAGAALTKKIYSGQSKEDLEADLMSKKSRLEERKGRKYFAWVKNNPKKTLAAMAIASTATLAALPVGIGVGAAGLCTVAGCNATVLGTASGVTLAASKVVLSFLGVNLVKKGISLAAGECQKRKEQ